MKKRFFLVGIMIVIAIALFMQNKGIENYSIVQIETKKLSNYKLGENAYIFYKSLNDAIEDINNDEVNNETNNYEEISLIVENKENEKNVILLSDLEVTNTIVINKDITIKLNGHTLNVTGTDVNTDEKTIYGFKIKDGVTLNVDGTKENSKIVHTGALGKNFYLFGIDLGGYLNVNSGIYELSSSDEKNVYFIYGDANTLEEKGINVSIYNTKINIESGRAASVLYHSINRNDSKAVICNNEISIKTNEYTGVFLAGYYDLNADNNKIEVISENSSAHAIWVNGKKVNITNNEINVSSNAESAGVVNGIRYFGEENGKCEIVNNNINCICSSKLDGYVRGINNLGGIMTVRNTTVLCDCPNNNNGTTGEEEVKTTSSGIRSSKGYLNIFDSNVKTNDYCISASEDTKLYVNGGTYQSYGHGPFYFSNGKGENYIENALLISLNKNDYDGRFTTDDWYEISSCMYIGGGENEYDSGISVHIDNSTIYDKGSKSGYFVLRGTSGEQNLSLYISNSEFKYDETEKMRIDHSSDHVYFGKGNTFTKAQDLPESIELSGNATVENNIHFTDEEYKKEVLDTKMEIKELPKKTNYIKNIDELDLTGGKIIVTNNIETEREIEMSSSDVIVSGFDSTKLGKQTITVKYAEFEGTFDVEVEDEKVEFIDYETEDDDGLICYIKPNTKTSDFKEKIKSNVSYEIRNKDGENEDTEIIGSENEIVTQLGTKIKIIVIGDNTGDGNADIRDMIKINNYRLFNTEDDFGKIYKKASDVNKDNKIDIRDMIMINNYRLFGTEF